MWGFGFMLQIVVRKHSVDDRGSHSMKLQGIHPHVPLHNSSKSHTFLCPKPATQQPSSSSHTVWMGYPRRGLLRRNSNTASRHVFLHVECALANYFGIAHGPF